MKKEIVETKSVINFLLFRIAKFWVFTRIMKHIWIPVHLALLVGWDLFFMMKEKGSCIKVETYLSFCSPSNIIYQLFLHSIFKIKAQWYLCSWFHQTKSEHRNPESPFLSSQVTDQPLFSTNQYLGWSEYRDCHLIRGKKPNTTFPQCIWLLIAVKHTAQISPDAGEQRP